MPAKYELNREAGFAEVTKRYLDYLQTANLPAWEVPNMQAKYYTTIGALRIASAKK